MTPTSMAQPPLSEEAAEKFAGKWVAVRNGTVIAAADSFEQLQADESVTETDATYHVPSSSSLFY